MNCFFNENYFYVTKNVYICSVFHPSPKRVSGWETGHNKKDVERNVLSAANRTSQLRYPAAR